MTTYLIKKGSVWEIEFRDYRHAHGDIEYGRAQTILFLTLGILTAACPIVFVVNQEGVSGIPPQGALIILILLITYLVMICGMGFRHWFFSEEKLDQAWDSVLKTRNG